MTHRCATTTHQDNQPEKSSDLERAFDKASYRFNYDPQQIGYFFEHGSVLSLI
ncbi:MAG: hypothetical protein IT497_00515 [Ottowia sp.]|nr:hypothetical protein [Ottowia sp.]